jgi:hypothetical protein
MHNKKLYNKAVHSSNNHTWKTPEYVFNYLDDEFEFTFDPCPTWKFNIQLWNGLEIEWSDMNFVNPPYGSELPKWIEKGIIEQKKKHYSVFLIPSRTDTKWFYKMYENATEIRFVVGRIKFVGAENSAPFPSMIVFFGPKQKFTSPKISMIIIPRH